MISVGAQEHKRFSQLLDGFAEVESSKDCEVNALYVDSREARQGGLFMACAGLRGHGVQYLSQARAAGVAAIAWEPSADTRAPDQDGWYDGVPLIAVDNLRQRLGFIADRFYGHPSRDLTVIGITGTDGKTSCSHFLAHSLQSDQRPTGLIGTLGYGLVGQLQTASHTTPDAIHVHRLLHQMRAQGARYVVMEVSSHGLDQGRVNGVLFELAVLTNVGRDHLDYHGDQASYARAKRQLFTMPGLRHAVINRDDSYGRDWVGTLPADVKLTVYGLDGRPGLAADNYIEVSAVELGAEGIDWHASSNWGESDLHNRLFGRFNVYNLAAVLASLNILGVDWDDACRYLQQLQTVPGRMEFCRSAHNVSLPLVVIDFAHTPDALGHVLQALDEHGFGRVLCVFGCGGDRDRGKRPLMGQVAESLADLVILTDDNPRGEDGDEIIKQILAGFNEPGKVYVDRDRSSAIAWAIAHAGPDDVVLVAGKGDESWQLIGDSKLPFSDRQVVLDILRRGEH